MEKFDEEDCQQETEEELLEREAEKEEVFSAYEHGLNIGW